MRKLIIVTLAAMAGIVVYAVATLPPLEMPQSEYVSLCMDRGGDQDQCRENWAALHTFEVANTAR